MSSYGAPTAPNPDPNAYAGLGNMFAPGTAIYDATKNAYNNYQNNFNPGNFEDIYGPITSPQYKAQQEDIRGQVARAYNAGTPAILGQAQARGLGAGSGAEAALLSRNAGQASSSYASGLAGLRQNYINARLQVWVQKLGAAQTMALLQYKYQMEKDAQKKSFWGSLINTLINTGGTVAAAA